MSDEKDGEMLYQLTPKGHLMLLRLEIDDLRLQAEGL